jgi:hypothetical protein
MAMRQSPWTCIDTNRTRKQPHNNAGARIRLSGRNRSLEVENLLHKDLLIRAVYSMYAALNSDPSDPDVIIKLDIFNAFNVHPSKRAVPPANP